MEDVEIIRSVTASMFIYSYILLKDNVSVPAREAALRILSVFLDQVLSRRAVYDALVETFKYMRWMGYEAPEPGNIPSDRDRARRMVIEYLRRRDDEDVIEYYRRVGLFITRLLVFYRFRSPDLIDEILW